MGLLSVTAVFILAANAEGAAKKREAAHSYEECVATLDVASANDAMHHALDEVQMALSGTHGDAEGSQHALEAIHHAAQDALGEVAKLRAKTCGKAVGESGH